jgi:DNA-directed RNA polymerase alpha subunit
VPSELLDRRVAELELPIHMMNALSNINVQTIRDLIAQPEANLVRALGKRRLKEIQDKLRELGIMP